MHRRRNSARGSEAPKTVTKCGSNPNSKRGFHEEKEEVVEDKDDQCFVDLHSAYNNLLNKTETTSNSLSNGHLQRKGKENHVYDFDGNGDYQPKHDNLRGLKCHKILMKCQNNAKKRLRAECEDDQSSFSGSSDDLYEEHAKSTYFDEEDKEIRMGQDSHEEDEVEQDMEVQSAYANLLEKFQTSSKSLASSHQKSLGEENVHGLEEKGDDQPTLRNLEGANDEAMGDDYVSNGGSGEDGGTCSSRYQSSFDSHMGHELSEKDVGNLSEHTWHMVNLGPTNCRWMSTGDSFLKDAAAAAPYGLEGNLYKHWLEDYNTSRGKNFQSSEQKLFFSLCNSYRDILHPNQEAFYQKGSNKVSSTMDAYIMHSLNHVFKSRDIVMKNNAKISESDALTGDRFRDQGFNRTKVLILLPLASIAFCLVRRLIQLTPSRNKVNVEYMNRFEKEFGVVEENEDELEAKRLKEKPSKHSNYRAFFGGKAYDEFVVGVKFTRKSIKLYSDYYSSDIIIASPLGLIRKIAEAKVNKEKDVDYLSSIEILIVDHADIMSMQSWDHVLTVVKHFNLLPSKPLKNDIRRIRKWSWDARFYRQTIILASYLSPDINALFNQHCVNFEGKLQLSRKYKGVLPKVLSQMLQVYERFQIDSLRNADDARLDYFVKKILPRVKDSLRGGIMLFISSYNEFFIIRNLLKSLNVSFCILSEHIREQKNISRARNWFLQRQRKVMLYTERAHFYNRHKIRGINNLIVYSLPERAEIYPEILNMLEGSHTRTTVLFSQIDKLRLERIVGSAIAKRMTTSGKDQFILK